MNKRGILIAASLVLTGILVFFSFQPKPTTAQSLDTAYASPINGGCYIAGPNQCKIHIDPFTINIENAFGKHLVQFTMYANGSPIYDFRTDVSNPPIYDYSPSPVALDFAANCGESYYLNFTVKTYDYPNPLNAGQTAEFTCPSNVP